MIPTEHTSVLDKVIAFADKAHGNQVRKYANERYIEHPKRVMKLCSAYTQKLEVLAAAVLHDVLEDTPVTRNEMVAFLSTVMTEEQASTTVSLVEELTDVYVKQDYPAWNRRKRKASELERLINTSADSQTIKYADIIDNSEDVVKSDPDFARVFLHEYNTMLKKLNKGDQQLYQKAVQKVTENLKRV